MTELVQIVVQIRTSLMERHAKRLMAAQRNVPVVFVPAEISNARLVDSSTLCALANRSLQIVHCPARRRRVFATGSMAIFLMVHLAQEAARVKWGNVRALIYVDLTNTSQANW